MLPPTKIARLVSTVYRQQMAILNRKLTPYHLGGGSYVFLLRVREFPGITQRELSRKLCIDKGTTSKMLRILEREQLITRTPNPDDKRNNNLTVTLQGEATCVAITDQVILAYRERMLAGIPAEDLAAATRCLERIVENLAEY